MQKKKCKSSTCKLSKPINEFRDNSSICKTCEDERDIRKSFRKVTKFRKSIDVTTANHVRRNT